MYRCFPDIDPSGTRLALLNLHLDGNRIAVGWQDDSGNWFHSYGNEPRQRIYLLNSVTSTKTCIDDIRFPGKLASITDAGVPELIVLTLTWRVGADHHQFTTDERGC
jgi:hypothetical protein